MVWKGYGFVQVSSETEAGPGAGSPSAPSFPVDLSCPPPHLSLGQREASTCSLCSHTRKWNANPGLFKEQEAESGWDPARQGASGQPGAPLCTWLDLREGCEQLQLQTQNYLKQLPDVVSELGLQRLLTG